MRDLVGPAPDPRAFTTFAEFEAIYRAASAATQTRPAPGTASALA